MSLNDLEWLIQSSSVVARSKQQRLVADRRRELIEPLIPQWPARRGTGTGIYRRHPQWGAAELLREGTFREEAARTAASQRYAGDAHVNLYYRVNGL